MSQLEHELGRDLFIRSPQGVDLTPAGKMLLVRAAAIIRQFDDLQDLTQDVDLDQRRLRIGMPPGVSIMLLDHLVRSVYREMEDVILTIEEEDSWHLLKQLSDGQLDIAVVSRRPYKHGIEFQPYFVEQLYFTQHGSQMGSPNAAELPFAVPDADEAFFNIAELAMSSLGRKPQIDMKLASIASIKRLVAEGHACTLGPYSAFSAELAAGEWSFEKVEKPLLYRDIVWRSDERQSDLVIQARAILEAVIRRCSDQAPSAAMVVLTDQGATLA